ncbi:hypothetical protein ACFL4Z_00605 [candidate division KSB1 bacterium]
MNNYYHTFYIPVMGTGHSVDTPIRIAPLGITSVISLVDDILLDKIRKYYSEMYNIPFFKIPLKDEDSRAKRINAYLNLVDEIVHIKMEAIKKLPFFKDNDKKKYFDLLPDNSMLKKDYFNLISMKACKARESLEKELTLRMKPGSIDVNIMVKLDRINLYKNENSLGEILSDAKAALKGYANSKLNSSIIFSAGINQSLFSYMTKFGDFYRNEIGDIKKKIVLKVSDYRSAIIQGKFLAKKGLEVSEFRIESGLNCGGHAFPSNGNLLSSILKKFKEKRNQLVTEFQLHVQRYYEKMGMKYLEHVLKDRPLITVQGGIGTNGEVRRLMEDFEMDRTGWATPFLLVPEATCVDAPTLNILKNAGKKELYLSNVSPIEIPFNNVRNTGSEIWTRKKTENGKPGSPCPKGFLVSNTEFTENPICLASRKYQKQKLAEIDSMPGLNGEREKLREKIKEKTCICDHLGNGALLNLGITNGKKSAPQSICPGPNLEWFNKIYTLKEMVDYIYGRGVSLVLPERPHMFASEIELYVDYFEKQIACCKNTQKEIETLRVFKDNLEEGMEYCLQIAKRKPFPGENLDSIPETVYRQKARLKSIYAEFEKMSEKKGNRRK